MLKKIIGRYNADARQGTNAVSRLGTNGDQDGDEDGDEDRDEYVNGNEYVCSR